jgi:peptide/nickel transport system substrate-binding protein
MTKWRIVVAACSLMGSVLVAAEAAAVQTLRIGLADDPDVLDPTQGRTYVGRIVFAALCDKLVDIGPELEIVPQLATEWQWADGNKALVLKLRTGVKFQDGEPLDAAAVKFNIERHLTMPGSNRKSEISAVTGVEIVDDHTVKLVLSAPFAPLLAQLTDRAGMMVSPKAARAARKFRFPSGLRRPVHCRAYRSGSHRSRSLRIIGTRTRSNSIRSFISRYRIRPCASPICSRAGST